MSFYFERRVKNLPVSNSARENRPVEDRNSDSVITLSDDELLESVKEFEKSEQFQNIQKQVEQAKGPKVFSTIFVEFSSFQRVRIRQSEFIRSSIIVDRRTKKRKVRRRMKISMRFRLSTFQKIRTQRNRRAKRFLD